MDDEVDYCDDCGLPTDACCCPDGEFSVDDEDMGGALDF